MLLRYLQKHADIKISDVLFQTFIIKKFLLQVFTETPARKWHKHYQAIIYII